MLRGVIWGVGESVNGMGAGVVFKDERGGNLHMELIS